MLDAATVRGRVEAITVEGDSIRVIEIVPEPGVTVPSFGAGAHLDLHLPDGILRSYSLINRPWERDRFVLGIAFDRASRGGSRYVHERLTVGDAVSMSLPRNHFPLHEDAPHSVLIAGGIGITPILTMIDRLDELGRGWELHYCARSRTAAGFLRRLREAKGAVHLHFDDETDGLLLDIPAIVAAAPRGSHFYCCGPRGMLDAYESATRGVAEDRVHLEAFSARDPAALAGADGSFEIELAGSGAVLTVKPGATILETLNQAGFDVPCSCLEGVCGSCETRVIAGIPDHRDSVLTASERESGTKMMICCSVAKSPRLVLDI